MNRPVKELMTKKYVKISEEDTLSEIVLRIAKDKETMLACVVDKNDTLKGIHRNQQPKHDNLLRQPHQPTMRQPCFSRCPLCRKWIAS